MFAAQMSLGDEPRKSADQRGVAMSIDIASAIRNRQVISFSYDGQPRIVLPAAYGKHVTTGSTLLRGYQTGGKSNSRTVPLWDLFEERKMVSAKLTGETFPKNPPGYKKGDKHLRPLLAEL